MVRDREVSFDVFQDPRSGIVIYLAHYQPGILATPPWGDRRCDCFIILGEQPVEAPVAHRLAHEVASLNNDWVYVYGTESERIHDLIDEASVRIGRQKQVGDGIPMTAWHTEILDLNEIATFIPGAQPVSLVLLVNHTYEQRIQLKKQILKKLWDDYLSTDSA